MSASYRNNSISKGRLQVVWITARQVMEVCPDFFSGKQEFRDWLESRFGERSTRALTIGQADEAIGAMKSILANGKPHVSYGQKQKMKALAALLGWNRKRLWGFIRKQTGQSKSEDMLLKKEATKVIIGLQRIIAGGDGELFNLLNRKPARWCYSEEGKQQISSMQPEPKTK